MFLRKFLDQFPKINVDNVNGNGSALSQSHVLQNMRKELNALGVNVVCETSDDIKSAPVVSADASASPAISNSTTNNATPQSPPLRVILSTNKWKANFNNPIINYSNGTVLEYGTWRILSIAPSALNTKFNAKQIETNFKDYEIYEAADGTIVTLYYYNQKWCLATSRGYDVSNLLWQGNMTYMQIIEDILRSNQAYHDFSFDRLDKSRCYTIGFKHPEFHPFQEYIYSKQTQKPVRMAIKRIWFIQSVNLDRLNDGQGYEINTNDTSLGLYVQKRARVKNVAEMLELADSAMELFNKSKILFGFVLRSRNPKVTRSQSNVLIESKLMKTIRQLWYNNKIHRQYQAYLNSQLIDHGVQSSQSGQGGHSGQTTDQHVPNNVEMQNDMAIPEHIQEAEPPNDDDMPALENANGSSVSSSSLSSMVASASPSASSSQSASQSASIPETAVTPAIVAQALTRNKPTHGKARNLSQAQIETANRVLSKVNYIILHSYLSYSAQSNIFITLFPQFKDQYLHYRTLFNQLVIKIIHIGSTEIQPNPTEPLDLLAHKLYRMISSAYKVDFSRRSEKVIRDMITDPIYINVYLA